MLNRKSYIPVVIIIIMLPCLGVGGGLMRRMDEKGVSPVIGVILMVAITVILAAVIASFVFGMASVAPAAPPSVHLTARTGSGAGAVEIKHMGGDPINCTEIIVLVNGKSDTNNYGFNCGNDKVLSVGESETINTGADAGKSVEITLVHTKTNKPILMTTVITGS